jgi:imidazolonepropionase-like amidohydrolase
VTEETAALMADRDVFLDFTFAAFQALSTGERYDNENPRRALEHQRSMLPTLRDHGVNFAMGTDAGTVVANGDNAVELGLMRDAGFDPLDAIRVATVESARMLGLDSVGRLAEGYAADLLAVRGNPLSDVTVLEDPDRVDLVLKGGAVVKDARPGRERHAGE